MAIILKENITGLDKQKFSIVNLFLPTNFNIVLGAKKNRLIETVLLSTHNMFWMRNKKISFSEHSLNLSPEICLSYMGKKYFIVTHFLTLFILMDYSVHIDTISMELSILYFKGFQVKVSIKNISDNEDCFYLSKQCRP